MSLNASCEGSFRLLYFRAQCLVCFYLRNARSNRLLTFHRRQNCSEWIQRRFELGRFGYMIHISPCLRVEDHFRSSGTPCTRFRSREGTGKIVFRFHNPKAFELDSILGHPMIYTTLREERKDTLTGTVTSTLCKLINTR